MKKTIATSMFLDEEDRRKLRRIAAPFEGNASMAIRYLIRKEYERITAKQPAQERELA